MNIALGWQKIKDDVRLNNSPHCTQDVAGSNPGWTERNVCRAAMRLDATISVAVRCVCRSDQLLRQLLISIKQPPVDAATPGTSAAAEIALDEAFDYDWLHEIGSGIDDCALPHHVSSDAEINDLIQRIRRLLPRLPRPAAITVTRSLPVLVMIMNVNLYSA